MLVRLLSPKNAPLGMMCRLVYLNILNMEEKNETSLSQYKDLKPCLETQETAYVLEP